MTSVFLPTLLLGFITVYVGVDLTRVLLCFSKIKYCAVQGWCSSLPRLGVPCWMTSSGWGPLAVFGYIGHSSAGGSLLLSLLPSQWHRFASADGFISRCGTSAIFCGLFPACYSRLHLLIPIPTPRKQKLFICFSKAHVVGQDRTRPLVPAQEGHTFRFLRSTHPCKPFWRATAGTILSLERLQRFSLRERPYV